MTSSYRIGTASNNKITIDTLPINIDPAPDYARYAEYVMLGDGTRRGTGWLETEWRWKRITAAEIATLRTYCSGVSAAVYIATPGIDGAFTAYSATMHWPQIPEPWRGSVVDDFVIEFTELVATGGAT